jgi:hypothetical protein
MWRQHLNGKHVGFAQFRQVAFVYLVALATGLF